MTAGEFLAYALGFDAVALAVVYGLTWWRNR